MFKDINDTIITTLGIDKLPEEDRAAVMERMGALVYQEVMLRVLDIMSEEDKDAFEKMINESPDPEVLFGFLAEKVPTIDTIVSEEAQKLKRDRDEVMSQIG